MNLENCKKKMSKYITITTILIVVASVCTFALVDFIANYVFFKNYTYNAIEAIGMIVPMLIVIGSISYIALRGAFSSLVKLINGIENVSNGNYFFKLTTNSRDPMLDVYSAFNKMTDELNSVQILRQDFLNNFSHEFKTPITSINGFANLLLEKEDLPEEKKQEYLQIIADESLRLSELSNSSLLMSKLDNQTIITDKEDYLLDEQIKKCAILLYNECEQKNINLDIDLQEVHFNGNYEIMQHLWINLLNNSIKFTPEGGEIKIKLYEKNSSIVAIIQDNGIGMDEETKNRIFEKYYQGDTSHHTKGLGIGLSICNRIITLCNGSITVQSKLNEGSQFTITLPK